MTELDVSEALADLGRNALRFAQCVTKLTAAFQSEGMTEECARVEARLAALTVLFGRADDGEDRPEWL